MYQLPGVKQCLMDEVVLLERNGHSLGRLGGVGDSGNITLVYARIDGQEHGTPLDSLFDIRVVTEAPRLAVEPDTLFYSNQPGADNTLHLWNEGSDALRIDSLRFSRVPPASDNGWRLELALSETTYSVAYAFGELEDWIDFPTITLSDDTFYIRFGAFDECLLCGDTAPKHSLQDIRDALFVYSNDERFNPYPIPIDFARYVAVDRPDALPSLSLEVYPNPSHGQATVRVVAKRAGRYAVTLYNVLGQRLAQEHAWLAPGQAGKLRWPEAGRLVPGGTYFVRLTDGRVYMTRM